MFAVYSSGRMDRNHWYDAGPRARLAALCADEDGAAAAAGGAHGGLPHRARRRPRADRRHRVVVDGLPRLQSSAHPRRPSSGSSRSCRTSCSAASSHEPALTLARRLAALLPGDLDRVFFSESGSVAVEVALKMAVQYWRNRGEQARTEFVAFRGGYHGDTTRRDGGERSRRRHARRCSAACCPAACIVDLPRRRERSGARSASARAAWRRDRRRSSSSRWCRAPAACACTTRDVLRRLRALRRPLRRAADLRRDLHRLRPHRADVRLRSGRRGARHHHARRR